MENKPEQKTPTSPQKEESFDDIIEKYGFKNTLSKEEEFELSISKKSFLSIETKFLDPDAELKRIFGSAAVNVDRNNRRNQHQPRRGGILVSQARVGHLPGGTGGLGCKVRFILYLKQNKRFIFCDEILSIFILLYIAFFY